MASPRRTSPRRSVATQLLDIRDEQRRARDEKAGRVPVRTQGPHVVRIVDEEDLGLVCVVGTGDLLAALPTLTTDAVAVWSRTPVAQIELFMDKRGYTEPPRIPYVSKIFPDPIDIFAALKWRERRQKPGTGFAVFSGLHGVKLTIDGVTGEVEADGEKALEVGMVKSKKTATVKNRHAGKLGPELAAKVSRADALRSSRTADGYAYVPLVGWCRADDVGPDRTAVFPCTV